MSDTNKLDKLLNNLDNMASSVPQEDGFDMDDPLKKVIEVSSKIKPVGESDLDDLWASFQEKIADSEDQDIVQVDDTKEIEEEKEIVSKTKTIHFKQYSLGVAASVSLLLACFFFFYHHNSSDTNIAFTLIKEVIKGEQDKVLLPDGSIVWLNAASRLYQQGDWSDQRSLKLEGEGFFEVKKGSKFTVTTEYGLVEVLGTSFNISAHKGEPYKVSCATGRVKVIVDGNSSTTLEEVLIPGEQVELKSNKLSKSSTVKKATFSEWKEGVFKFKQASLLIVSKELGRQFNVSVEVGKDVDKLFTGSFSNQNIDNALQTVCIQLGLTYEIKEGIVSIK